jgi:DNA polymerase III sliding clamp (beta) subunit (PCNA family)
MLDCYRVSLVEAVGFVGQVVKTATTLPELSCLRLRCTEGGLHVEATDLDNTGTSAVDLDGLFPGEFDRLIPARLLRAILGRSGETVVGIGWDEKAVKIGGFTIPSLPGYMFPQPKPEDYSGERLGIDPGVFARAGRFVADPKAGRRFLEGVYISGDQILATDGRRIHAERTGWTPGKRFALVGREFAAMVAGMDKPELSLGKTTVRATDGPRTVIAKQIEQANPTAINQVLSHAALSPEAVAVQLCRSDLAGAVESAQILAGGVEAGALRLEIGETSLGLFYRSELNGEFKAILPLENRMERPGPLVAGFAPGFLAAAIKAFSDLPGDSITLHVSENPPKLWIQSEGRLHCVMGMRIAR